MKATVLSVGNELLSGLTTNTNLVDIARELFALGIETRQSVSVPDDKQAIQDAIKHVDDDLLVVTGGLGPTHDDITKESICDYYRLELSLHHETKTRIENYFKRLGREMRDTNEKQAYFPKDAIVLTNNHGTAPGVIFSANGTTVVLLPGPPSEMRPMLERVKTYLKERMQTSVYSAGYLVVGIGESELEADMAEYYPKHPDVNIAPYAGLSQIRVVFVAHDARALDKALDDFKRRFRAYIVGPHDATIEQRLVDTLIAQGKVISFAESCTGGMMASTLVSVPDASQVLNESYVLYSNESKIKHLGINRIIMERFGAVSEQCVYELAYHLAHRTDADITLSVSGIAGPSGGTAAKPVGTVYYGIHHEGKTKTYHRVFSGDRNMIRTKATVTGMALLLKALMHEDDHS